jgi:hypothetical protein
MHRLEANRKKKKTSQKLNQARHFIKEKYLQKSASPLIDSQAKYK